MLQDSKLIKKKSSKKLEKILCRCLGCFSAGLKLPICVKMFLCVISNHFLGLDVLRFYCHYTVCTVVTK